MLKPESEMKIIFLNQKPAEWDELLSQAYRANWMQSWPYARAVYTRDFKSTRFAAIQKDDKKLGIVAIQEIRLGPIHFIEIQRGPLWFDKDVKAETFIEFAKLLRKTFPRRLLRRFRWLPEWSLQTPSLKEMTELGYKLRPQTYETVWIDLTVSLQEIRKGLDSKWRNGLNKSEQQELKVTVDQQGRWLTSFLKSYQEFKQDKGFLGPSLDFMKEEFLAAQPMQKSILILAQQSGLHVAGLMIMMHGRSASYRIGWNSELGKKTNAHSLLLWKAIEFLKEKGMTSLDLGGVKSKESPGITHFKTGMGGEYVQFLGFFS